VRAARNTEGFATTGTVTVNKSLPDAWQAVKEVLRDKGLDLYTRDKRGVFIAFSPMKRNLFLVPTRIKYTVALESLSDSSTKVTVDAVRQVYGVTLLTYPNWHDRKTTDGTLKDDILSALGPQ
jgi:hypothetical protein